MNLFAFALVVVAFTFLHLGSERRTKQMTEPSVRKNPAFFRSAGWLLIALSIAVCAFANGMAIGLTLWFGLAAVAAALVTLILAYAAKLLPGVGGTLCLCACTYLAFFHLL